MRHLFSFFGAQRAGRFIGVLALIAGTISVSVLGVATPAADAATRVPTPKLDRLPAAAAAALSSRAAREAEAAAARRGWTQASEVTSPEGPSDDSFGYAVAISGTTMVVGSQGADNDLGVAYVFTGSGSTWTYATTLNPDGVTNDNCTPVCQEFGQSVALSSGNIVVGAPGMGANGAGAVFVYHNGAGYAERTELNDPGQVTGDYFGDPVAVSSNAILVAADQENAGEGAVYAYDPSTFAMTEVPEPPGAVSGDGNYLGVGLAISGSTLVVGAPGTPGTLTSEPEVPGYPANSGEAYTGAVDVYTGSGTSWAYQHTLVASNGEGCLNDCADVGGDWFGYSVAIKGKTVAVGAPWATAPSPPSTTGPEPDGGTSDAPSSTGTAYVFKESGTTWTQKAELYDPAEVTAGNQDWFGLDVAMLGASSLVVTAPYDSSVGGAAFVFAGHRSGWPTYPTELTALNGSSGEGLGYEGLATVGSNYAVVGDPGVGVYFFKK